MKTFIINMHLYIIQKHLTHKIIYDIEISFICAQESFLAGPGDQMDARSNPGAPLGLTSPTTKYPKKIDNKIVFVLRWQHFEVLT